MLNNVPYAWPGTLIAVAISILSALWVGRPSWIIPAVVFWGGAGFSSAGAFSGDMGCQFQRPLETLLPPKRRKKKNSDT